MSLFAMHNVTYLDVIYIYISWYFSLSHLHYKAKITPFVPSKSHHHITDSTPISQSTARLYLPPPPHPRVTLPSKCRYRYVPDTTLIGKNSVKYSVIFMQIVFMKSFVQNQPFINAQSLPILVNSTAVMRSATPGNEAHGPTLR